MCKVPTEEFLKMNNGKKSIVLLYNEKIVLCCFICNYGSRTRYQSRNKNSVGWGRGRGGGRQGREVGEGYKIEILILSINLYETLVTSKRRRGRKAQTTMQWFMVSHYYLHLLVSCIFSNINIVWDQKQNQLELDVFYVIDDRLVIQQCPLHDWKSKVPDSIGAKFHW